MLEVEGAGEYDEDGSARSAGVDVPFEGGCSLRRREAEGGRRWHRGTRWTREWDQPAARREYPDAVWRP